MKSETRNPKQIQMTKIQNPKRDCFAALAMTRVVIKIILPLDFWPLLLLGLGGLVLRKRQRK